MCLFLRYVIAMRHLSKNFYFNFLFTLTIWGDKKRWLDQLQSIQIWNICSALMKMTLASFSNCIIDNCSMKKRISAISNCFCRYPCQWQRSLIWISQAKWLNFMVPDGSLLPIPQPVCLQRNWALYAQFRCKQFFPRPGAGLGVGKNLSLFVKINLDAFVLSVDPQWIFKSNAML